jgi:hypothetical protein
MNESNDNPEPIIHRSPWPDWYASQVDGTGVWICDRASGQTIKVEPPAEWERHWGWNITEDGTGVELRRRG